jgi:hypothetical protein
MILYRNSLIQSCKNFSASSCWQTLGQFGFKGVSAGAEYGTILKAASDLNLFTSRSRSTIKRTATDCTRPAESDGFTFFQSTGESSKPTSLSKTRRACCAFTRL